MEPVLEHPPLAQKLVQVRGFISRYPTPQDVVVRPLDHGQGINLDIPEVFDGLQRPSRAMAKNRRCAQPLLVQGQ
jgi:hypothetical protein